MQLVHVCSLMCMCDVSVCTRECVMCVRVFKYVCAIKCVYIHECV